MAGQEGRKKETNVSTQSLTVSLSHGSSHHTVHLSSPLQSATCSTHSPSWTQSLAHSQLLTHCPLQSCQISCNHNRVSELSEKEEQFVLHRAPEFSIYQGRGGMELLTSWQTRHRAETGRGQSKTRPFRSTSSVRPSFHNSVRIHLDLETHQ